MTDTTSLFEAMRRSPLNNWVGGADPRDVGEASCDILERYLPFGANSRVLDFGCGIGRVLVTLLRRRPEIESLSGFDILPQVIDFCREQIAAQLPRTSFELIEGSNVHYDHFAQAAERPQPKARRAIEDEYAATFSAAYAFSVFTHLEANDFRSALGLLSHLLQPGGSCLFTAFLLTAKSRNAIAAGDSVFGFGNAAYEADGTVFIGNVADRLGFIAFDLRWVEQAAHEAGLVVTRIEFGSWAGPQFSSSLQDVIVCQRPLQPLRAPPAAAPMAPPPAAPRPGPWRRWLRR